MLCGISPSYNHYEDEWGRFYSAYSPVFDSHGKVGGIVAVDFSAEWFDRQLAREMTTTLVMIVVSLVIGAGITEMSMGWAVFDSGRDREYRAVFKRADDAMYADKAAYYKTHPDRRRG